MFCTWIFRTAILTTSSWRYRGFSGFFYWIALLYIVLNIFTTSVQFLLNFKRDLNMRELWEDLRGCGILPPHPHPKLLINKYNSNKTFHRGTFLLTSAWRHFSLKFSNFLFKYFLSISNSNNKLTMANMGK